MSRVRRKSISHLHDHLGYWLRMISNHVSQNFSQKLEGLGVTVAEWVVLREMYGSEDDIPPSQVADLTGLSRGAISKLIERLIQKDLVEREEGSEDRRFQVLRLSAKGFRLIPELAKIADENDDLIFSVLAKAEQEKLKEIMMKLATKHDLKKSPII